jgi:hypothetical protein
MDGFHAGIGELVRSIAIGSPEAAQTGGERRALPKGRSTFQPGSAAQSNIVVHALPSLKKALPFGTCTSRMILPADPVRF